MNTKPWDKDLLPQTTTVKHCKTTNLASFGIIGLGAPSFSQCVGFER